MNTKLIINILNKISENEMLATIIGGIIVFVFTQIVIEFIVKPRIELSKLKKKIATTLTMYRNLYHNPVRAKPNIDYSKYPKYQEAEIELRKVASELSGYISIKRKKRKEKENSMETACKYLIGLSNNLFEHHIEEDIIKENIQLEKGILDCLKIRLL